MQQRVHLAFLLWQELYACQQKEQSATTILPFTFYILHLNHAFITF